MGAPGSLVRLTPVPAGSTCANGGVRIDVGVDANGNGVLDDGEVEQTATVCSSGESGAPDGGEPDSGPVVPPQPDGGPPEPPPTDGGLHEPPCPITDSSPVGNYTIQAIEDVRTHYTPSPNDTGWSAIDAHSISRATDTLTLSLWGSGPPLLEGLFSSPGLGFTSDFFFDPPEDMGTEVRYTSPFGGESAQDSIVIDVDRRTGVVTSLVVSAFPPLGPFANTSVSITGTGWPVCPATQTSPPTWVEPPPAPASDVPLGCTAADVSSSNSCPTPPADPCGPVGGKLTSCTNSDYGYAMLCCPGAVVGCLAAGTYTIPYSGTACGADTSSCSTQCNDVSGAYQISVDSSGFTIGQFSPEPPIPLVAATVGPTNFDVTSDASGLTGTAVMSCDSGHSGFEGGSMTFHVDCATGQATLNGGCEGAWPDQCGASPNWSLQANGSGTIATVP